MDERLDVTIRHSPRHFTPGQPYRISSILAQDLLLERKLLASSETSLRSRTSVDTKFDYNTWYIGLGSTGALTDRLAYGVEFVYEGGDTLSSPFVRADTDNDPATPLVTTAVDQTRDDISAFAANLQLDYLVGDRRNTRLSGEVIFATGDSDRVSSTNTFAGNKTGTDDQDAFFHCALPTSVKPISS